MSLPRTIEPLALCALVAAATALLIGDFAVRLAASTADDSPALLAHVLVNPARFQGDVLESFATVYGLGTLVHWGPALLLRYFRIAPETTSLVLVYAQNVLLALAVWLLARAAGADRTVAWAAALFTLAAEVYLWNLANYRSQMQVPYAGHLVLAPITGAAAWLLQRRYRALAIALVVAALVHPTVTLLTLPPFALTLLLRTDAAPRSARALLPAALVLLPAFCAALGIALLVRSAAPAPLPAADLLAAMRSNVHMNPLGSTRLTHVLLPAYSAFLLLLAIAFRQRVLSDTYRRLLLATFAATALYALAHVLALQFGATLVITFVPLRFTMLLALLAMPAIVLLLIDGLRDSAFALRWAAAAMLVLLPLSSLAVHWPALVVLAALRLLPRDLRHHDVVEKLAIGLLALWSIAALAAFAELTAVSSALALLTRGANLNASALTGAIAVAGLLAWLWQRSQARTYAPLLAATLCAGLLLLRNATKGAETRDGQDRDLYAAQLWAQRESAGDAVFIIEPNVPWRVISERRALPLWPNDAHVYSGSRDAFEYARAVRAHVTRHPLTDTAAIVAFRQRFGGDYLVREAERPAPYAAVYRNEHFAIYRLPELND